MNNFDIYNDENNYIIDTYWRQSRCSKCCCFRCCKYTHFMSCWISFQISVLIALIMVVSIVLMSMIHTIDKVFEDPTLYEFIRKLSSIINITCDNLNC